MLRRTFGSAWAEIFLATDKQTTDSRCTGWRHYLLLYLSEAALEPGTHAGEEAVAVSAAKIEAGGTGAAHGALPPGTRATGQTSGVKDSEETAGAFV